MKYTDNLLEQNMKLLFSLMILGLIGFTVPVFAEEMYPVLGVPEKVTVNLDNFERSNTVIFNLEFTDIKWVSESEWDNTEFHQSVDYENSDGVHAADLTKSQLAALDGLKIETFEEHGNEYISFRFTNLNKIIAENADTATLRLELYSDTIQHGVSIDELYSGSFAVVEVDSQTFNFYLPEKPTTQEKVNMNDQVIIPKEIPSWVKNIFKFYADDIIGDAELIGALQYLIKEGIIEV